MAPKYKGCFRCGSITCDGRKDKEFLYCNAPADEPLRWQDFPNLPEGQSISNMLTDDGYCEELLSHAPSFTGKEDKLRVNSTFRGTPIWKELLDVAFARLHKPKTKLSKAEAKAAKAASSLTINTKKQPEAPIPKPSIPEAHPAVRQDFEAFQRQEQERLQPGSTANNDAEDAQSDQPTVQPQQPAMQPSLPAQSSLSADATTATPPASGKSQTDALQPVTSSVFKPETPTLTLPFPLPIDTTGVEKKQENALHDVRAAFKELIKHPKVEITEIKAPEKRFALRTSISEPQDLEIYTNHFAVSLEKGIKANVELFEYVIHSESTEWTQATRNKRKVLIRSLIDRCDELRNNFDIIASDYHTKIIAAQDVLNGQVSKVVKVQSYRRGTRDAPVEVDLRISHNRTLSLKELQEYVSGENIAYAETGAAESLNIIIAKAISDKVNGETFQAGNNKFFYRPGWHELGPDGSRDPSGLIAVRGYSCSVRPAMGTVTLNINAQTGAFHRPDLVQELINESGMTEETLNNHLKGLRVWVNFERAKAYPDSPDIDGPIRRTKIISGVGKAANKEQFERCDVEVGNKGSVTVQQHIAQTYPGLNMALGQLAINVGGKDSPKFYMSGHLRILGDQMFKRKLPSDLVATMIEVARRTPAENREAILQEGISSLGIHHNQSKLFKALGMAISKDMMSVPARCIPGPSIQYAGKSSPIDLNKTTAKWTTKSQKFVKTDSKFGGNGKVRFLCVDDDPKNAPHQRQRSEFVDGFMKDHAVNGLPKLTLDTNGNRKFFTRAAKSSEWSVDSLTVLLKEWKNTGLVVLMLPSSKGLNPMRYANFKIVCDQIVGLTSAVLCEERMAGQNGKLIGYVSNVAMKLNLRLGNANHHISQTLPDSLKRDCMIMGADVTHPSGGGNQYTPSIAAVVASVDNDFALFPGSMRMQPRRQEQIAEMDNMTMECLKRYAEKHKKLPTCILFYRDGVDESYYDRVLQHEVRMIRDAWENLRKAKYGIINRKPLLITTVIVAKRHNTRFYPKADDGTSCLPGTVVDSGVTSPYFFDFFLQSHTPLQGTAKPTHYFVLKNDMNLKPKELQDFTNNLCYLYGRSTTAVSYVPPAYYADRLCERGRHYLRRFFDNDQSVKTLSKEAIEEQLRNDWLRADTEAKNPWHSSLNGKMFWM